MSALQGKEVARSVTHTLEDLLSDDQVNLFWEQVKTDASRLSVGDPVLFSKVGFTTSGTKTVKPTLLNRSCLNQKINATLLFPF